MPSTGIKIIEIRISNFRLLKQFDVKLEDLTVLVGEEDVWVSDEFGGCPAFS